MGIEPSNGSKDSGGRDGRRPIDARILEPAAREVTPFLLLLMPEARLHGPWPAAARRVTNAAVAIPDCILSSPTRKPRFV
jgi:hypothetical protein